MQTQQIIELAKLAGWEIDDSCVISPQNLWYMYQTQLETFANLVAKAKAEEIATELLKGPVNDTAASIAIWIRDQA